MSQVIDNLIKFYGVFAPSSLTNLGDIYTDDVIFEDPIHRIVGVANLRGYFEQTMKGLSDCRFEFSRRIEGDALAFLEWEMHYQHRSIKGGRPLILEGSSVLEMREGKISVQRDYYDMGQMVYEHVPLLGAVVKGLKKRIAS